MYHSIFRTENVNLLNMKKRLKIAQPLDYPRTNARRRKTKPYREKKTFGRFPKNSILAGGAAIGWKIGPNAGRCWSRFHSAN